MLHSSTSKDLPLMSIGLDQTALRWWLNLPANCWIVSLCMHCHCFNLPPVWILPTSQRWQSMADMSIFQTEMPDFPFITYVDLYFTYLWNPFDSYYHHVEQNEEFVKKRQASRRAGDGAAVRQPSYRGASSFQRLKCVRVTTKTKLSISISFPLCLSSFHFLFWNIGCITVTELQLILSLSFSAAASTVSVFISHWN